MYPAAALRCWGLSPAGYKEPDGGDRRRELLTQLGNHPRDWLRLSLEARKVCEASGYAFDALVAALVARAAALGLCEPVPEDTAALAESEG